MVYVYQVYRMTMENISDPSLNAYSDPSFADYIDPTMPEYSSPRFSEDMLVDYEDLLDHYPDTSDPPVFPDDSLEYNYLDPRDDYPDDTDDYVDAGSPAQVRLWVILVTLGVALLAIVFLSVLLGRKFRHLRSDEATSKPARMNALWKNISIVTFRPAALFRSSSSLVAAFSSRRASAARERDLPAVLEDETVPILVRGTDSRCPACSPTEGQFTPTETSVSVEETRSSSQADIFFECHCSTPAASRRPSEDDLIEDCVYFKIVPS